MNFDRSKPGKYTPHDAWAPTEQGWRINVCAEVFLGSGEVKIFATPAGCTIALRFSREDALALAAELVLAADSLKPALPQWVKDAAEVSA
jgi:hypothetical protein